MIRPGLLTAVAVTACSSSSSNGSPPTPATLEVSAGSYSTIATFRHGRDLVGRILLDDRGSAMTARVAFERAPRDVAITLAGRPMRARAPDADRASDLHDTTLEVDLGAVLLEQDGFRAGQPARFPQPMTVTFADGTSVTAEVDLAPLVGHALRRITIDSMPGGDDDPQPADTAVWVREDEHRGAPTGVIGRARRLADVDVVGFVREIPRSAACPGSKVIATVLDTSVTLFQRRTGHPMESATFAPSEQQLAAACRGATGKVTVSMEEAFTAWLGSWLRWCATCDQPAPVAVLDLPGMAATGAAPRSFALPRGGHGAMTLMEGDDGRTYLAVVVDGAPAGATIRIAGVATEVDRDGAGDLVVEATSLLAGVPPLATEAAVWVPFELVPPHGAGTSTQYAVAASRELVRRRLSVIDLLELGFGSTDAAGAVDGLIWLPDNDEPEVLGRGERLADLDLIAREGGSTHLSVDRCTVIRKVRVLAVSDRRTGARVASREFGPPASAAACPDPPTSTQITLEPDPAAIRAWLGSLLAP